MPAKRRIKNINKIKLQRQKQNNTKKKGQIWKTQCRRAEEKMGKGA